MYIEDIINRLAGNGIYIFEPPVVTNKNDWNILFSLSTQIEKGNAFTEKQRALSLRLITKYTEELTVLGIDVLRELANPIFQFPVRVLSDIKTVSIDNDEAKILVSFPFDQEIVDLIKAYKQTLPYIGSNGISWDSEKKLWAFMLNEQNIKFVGTLAPGKFHYDDQFMELFHSIEEIEKHFEDYIPIVVFEDGEFRYKNTVKSIPQPSSNNVIEVLLEARRYGINCWDDSIDLALQSIEPAVYGFLKNASGQPIEVQPEGAGLNNIKDILDLSNNVLVIIPGGTELEHLRYTHQYLTSIGHPETEMTVLFRLDSSFGQVCNDYIKEHKLNTPISNDVKFVFISGKIPKPLIASGKQFDLVIHYGTNSAHYTLKNYVKQHHNVISMNLPTSKIRELKFV
jgi:hypothetical protein